MKIGIVTLYDDQNFGNKLQNYAVQKFFEKLGYSCETIPYYEMVNEKLSLKSMIHTFFAIIGIDKKRYALRRRRKYIKTFSSEYLHLRKCIKLKKLPKSLNDEYDYFVVGSDQVWRNWTSTSWELEYFLLNFASEKKRYSISPSFGKNSIEEIFEKKYCENLKRFQLLTCREERGCELIEECSGRRAILLLDPTMLIDIEDWEKILRRPSNFSVKKYILLYALGEISEKVKKEIVWINQAYNYEVIDIYNINNDFYTTTRPDEFLYWIKHAEIVLTDSFHACIFSILFNRNFLVFDRIDACMENMESRIETLLKTFQLEKRKIDVSERQDYFSCDFTHIAEILNAKRRFAYNLYVENLK